MPFKIDLGDIKSQMESAMRRAMPAYFVEILRWMFTMVMIFGSILSGIILAAPKLRAQMPFLGRLADDLRPFKGIIGMGTAWRTAGGWLGLATGIDALYVSFAEVTNATFKKNVIPLGAPILKDRAVPPTALTGP